MDKNTDLGYEDVEDSPKAVTSTVFSETHVKKEADEAAILMIRNSSDNNNTPMEQTQFTLNSTEKLVCEFCSKKCRSTADLSKHHKFHCKKNIASRIELNTHLLDNSDDKTYPCHFCQKKFSFQHNLNRHLKVHCGDNSSYYSCYLCERKYLTKNNLRIHLKAHYSDKPFSCNICQETFAIKRSLTEHLIIHSIKIPLAVREPSHPCVICHKMFAYKSQVKTHMIVHSGEKPQSCITVVRYFELKKN